MREKCGQKYVHNWVPGVVTLLVFAVVYAIDGFFPFGTGSIAALDLNTQYLPLLYKFYDVVKGTSGLIVDHHIAGGMNLYPEMITELLNPFNYVLLLCKREHLYLAINMLPVLYGAAASVTASYAIGKCCGKRSCMNVILGVCYGLSFYNAYQYEIIRWMYLVVLFPLFAVSLKKLLEKEKMFGYTLFLAYQLMLSLQLGVQTCLFALCASICYMLYLRASGREDGELRTQPALRNRMGKKCLLLGTATVAALLLSSVNLVPSLYNVLHSSRSEENQALISVITQHGLDDILERFLEIGHPVVFGVLAGIFLLLRRSAGRLEHTDPPEKKIDLRRRYMVFFLLLLLATVILQPSNLLWHLGYYQCFPVRYGYMILLMWILFAAKSDEEIGTCIAGKECAEERDGEKGGAAWPIAVLVMSGIFVLTVFAVAVAKRLMFSYAFATLAVSRICIKETLLFYVLMGLLAAAAMVSYLSGKTVPHVNPKYGKALLLAAAAVAGTVCYLCVLFPQTFEARTENENAYRTMGELGNTTFSYSQAGHVNDEESLLLNAPLVSGQYALTAYMPAGADRGFSSAMDQLGYSSPWVSVRSEGGTVISDTLLGIHNPYVADNGLQNGILISEEACRQLEEDVKTDSPMAVQKSILRAMCSGTSFGEDEIMQVWRGNASQVGEMQVEGVEKLSSNALQLTVTEPLLVYIWTGDTTADLFVNGEPLEKEEVHQSQNFGRIRFAGAYAQGKVSFSAADPSFLWDDTEIALIRSDAFCAMCEELALQNQRVIEPDDRHGKLYIHSESAMQGVLLLPFAHIEGYRADASQAAGAIRITSFLDGLMQVHLTEPLSEIALTYHYDILKWALLASFIGALLLAAVLLSRIFDRISAVFCRAAGVVFALTAILFLLGVYVCPNLGMAGYMTGRLLGRDLLEDLSGGEKKEASAPVLLQAAMEEDGIHVVVAGENLVTSLGARMSADSVEANTFKAQKAGDGIVHDASSRWSSENDWENADHYLQADLRGRQTIRALRIFWFQTNAKTYEILVSDDKSFAESTVMASFTEAPAAKEQVICFERPVEARYVRIAVKDVNRREEDLSLYYQNISIEELEVYGDDAASFVIEKPVLPGGSNREIPIPEVPAGYALSVGGVNYRNLLTDEDRLADTYAPVEINLGYVLTCGKAKFELPGFDVLLPASDESKADDFPYHDIAVREWKAAAGVCRASEGLVSEQTDEVWLAELGEEGYRIEIGEQSILLTAGTQRGLCFARVTLEQMVRQKEELPCGLIRDYPAYPVRGFCMDVARRPIPMEMLYDMVDALAARKMNTLQLHLNDNAIIAESDHDNTVEGARKLYSAFRLESELAGENGGILTAEDLYYTKEEFRALADYALQKGVEIVPEIDTPAHSMAFTKIMPSLGYKNDPELADTLDIGNPKVLPFVEHVWEEYLSGDERTDAVFETCGTIHLGMDEFYGKPALYEAYVTGLTDYIRESAPEKTIRIWGSLSGVGADPNRIPKDIELMIWNSYWADPKTMYDAGFKVINCLNSDLYIIVGSGSDHLNVESLAQDWQPNRFADGQTETFLPAWSDRMMGACYSLWNDHYTKGIDNTSETDLMERFEEPLQVISERLW